MSNIMHRPWGGYALLGKVRTRALQVHLRLEAVIMSYEWELGSISLDEIE